MYLIKYSYIITNIDAVITLKLNFY
jgi:hypothetical protein